MNLKQDFPWLPILGAFCVLFFIFQRSAQRTDPDAAFYTEQAQYRNLTAVVNARGLLIPEEITEIGNLVNGIVRYLYAEENDLINEGQILAEIDDSLEDSSVNATFGDLDAAQAVLRYQLEYLKRQEQLFGCKQISLDAYQQSERNYQEALAKVEASKARYETAKLIYNNKRIKSPVSGMVIARSVTLGQAVSDFPPATILYFIANNIKHLQAHIMLDEKDLEIMKPGVNATIAMDLYPHEQFTLPVEKITRMPHSMQADDYVYSKLIPKTNSKLCYCAVIPFANDALLFKPGATFTARIVVDQKEKTLCIPQQALAISTKTIEQLAHQTGYSYQPIAGTALTQNSYENPKTVWVLEHKTFVQKEISTGISDGDFVEITKGLRGSENIVCSINEDHSITQAFKNYFTHNAKA